MAEIVCRRCGQHQPALEQPPLPGRFGPLVQAETCQACWADWIEEQTRLINHEGLRPAEPAHRAQLYARMRTYLNLSA